MKKRISQILCLVLVMILAVTQTAVISFADTRGSDITMNDFRVCSLKEPIGIDTQPVFSWILSGSGRDQSQSAYRIRVSSTRALAEAGTGDIWDSGRVDSADSFDIKYEGKDLTSKTTYYWTAESFVGRESVKSDVQIFSTGILNADEWQGEWIGKERNTLELAMNGANWIWRLNGDGFAGAPAGTQYFRKTFNIRNVNDVSRVLIGYSADDSSVLYFNGKQYGETSTWSTGGLFDATKMLVNGENTVALSATNATAGYAGLIAKISIEYTDGSTDTIVSDKSWLVSETEQDGWYENGYNASGWKNPDQSVAFGESPWGSGISLELYGSRAAVMLRNEFELKGEVKEAYAYICGLGFFELTINGTLPDDSVMNPFTTQYNKRVLYRTFEVTDLLKSGKNAVGVELGNSYYNEIGGVWNWQTASWRDDPKLMFNLEIKYADGSSETVVSDTDWTVTNAGPITSNSMYYGETYDARREQTGFNTVGFNDSAWDKAVVVDAPEGVLSAQMKAPIRRVAEFKPADIKKLDNGSYIITAPEMTAGWIKLMNINEQQGQKITITYGQRLADDGTVVLYGGGDGEIGHWWPHAYIQQDNYICKGTGNESFEPKFSYKGHQYIQIDGYTGELTADDVTIYRVSNDVDIISEFSSSNELVNRLHHMMRTAMANNFEGEHCDPVLEKNGWTGDANVSIGSLMYNFDMTGSLPGFLQILGDCFDQYDTVPVMAPTADWWIDNTIVWNSLYVYGVMELENKFGTGAYAEERYDTMRRYTVKQISELKSNGWVWYDGQLGDWVSPIGGSDPNVQYNENISEGSGITGTAFAYGVLEYMADLADRLGKTADAEEYRAAMSSVYDAFQKKYYKSDKGYYETNTWSQIGTRTRYRQTDNLVALAFGLVPEENVDIVLGNLLKDIEEKDWHLDTGCVGTRYILPVLCDYGYSDVAYRILTQTTYPSWGFWVENGATSTWEMWESTTRSFDHYFLGTYDEWFYSHLAGIRDITDGYGSYTVDPGIIGDLTEVDCTLDTVRGEAGVNWTRENSEITVNVKVPMGAEVKVLLPVSDKKDVKIDGKTLSESIDGIHSIVAGEKLAVTVGSGEYSFVMSDSELPVYKTALEQAVNELKNRNDAEYDSATQEKIDKALSNAEKVIADTAATQTEVNAAKTEVATLLALLDGSEARRSLSDLVAKLSNEALPDGYYPADLKARFDSALLTADKLSKDMRISDDALASAKEKLEQAFEAMTAKKAANLALGGAVDASSTNNDGYWGWDISYLNDGIFIHESRQAGEYTGYCSNLTPNVDHTEWVSVDLGSVKEINNVVFYSAASLTDGEMMGYGFPVDFKIQVSDDNQNWTTVREEKDYPVKAFGPLDFGFDATNARYVRLLAEKLRTKPSDANSYRLQLAEMEVYDLSESAGVPLVSYIELSDGVLEPVFDCETYEYKVDAGTAESIDITLYAVEGVSLTCDGAKAVSGTALKKALQQGENSITITASVGDQTVTYTVLVTRARDILLGDLDKNGVVNVSDIIMLKNLIMNGSWNDENLMYGDIDKNGTLNVSDMLAIKNIIMSA